VASAVLFYVLGAVLGMATTGSSLITQPVAALLMVLSGAWIAWSALRQPYTKTVGVKAQPRVQ
jgi:ABC-type nickel/cobalt efflux system permease component RcnA